MEGPVRERQHCSDGKRVNEREGERPTENESDRGKAGDYCICGGWPFRAVILLQDPDFALDIKWCPNTNIAQFEHNYILLI